MNTKLGTHKRMSMIHNCAKHQPSRCHSYGEIAKNPVFHLKMPY